MKMVKMSTCDGFLCTHTPLIARMDTYLTLIGEGLFNHRTSTKDIDTLTDSVIAIGSALMSEWIVS